MLKDFWKDKYPAGIPHTIDVDKYKNVLQVFQESVRKYADRPAYSNMGRTLTYRQVDELSKAFAAYLQNETDLQPGDRIAIQMPNLLQYPIAVFGAMRAGLVVVNTNPLYTSREMLHQFNDAGCKALVCLANFGNLAQEVVPQTNIRHVIVTEVGDALPYLKRKLTNYVVKHVKRLVPEFSLPNAVRYVDVIAKGRKLKARDYNPSGDDVAVLQYTGGTTGVSKGAMLTHRNLAANMLQTRAVLTSIAKEGEEVMIAPLPLYHIFAFNVCCLSMMDIGAHTVLITNPRDIPGFVKELSKWKFTAFAGLNTLFVALLNNADFKALDFSSLKFTVAGGMALQHKTAELWEAITGSQICEGYGMTETSPVQTINPPVKIQLGTIGIPVPNTELKVVNDQNQEVPLGEPGELCVRGPQVMKGYWQRPEATAETIDADGWLHTGDVAVIQPDGYLRIVDRKKDMILVSGFNVYPNEIEDVVATHPGVLECAVVGVPDEKSGEAVKLFVVPKYENVTEGSIMDHCRANLTGYKMPKYVAFRKELPKSNVGKILRRELRNL